MTTTKVGKIKTANKEFFKENENPGIQKPTKIETIVTREAFRKMESLYPIQTITCGGYCRRSGMYAETYTYSPPSHFDSNRNRYNANRRDES